MGGRAFLYLAPWTAAAVVVLPVVVALSDRQVVHAYPSGGGDCEVAIANHGQFAVISAFPALNQSRVLIAVVRVALWAAANLRGTACSVSPA